MKYDIRKIMKRAWEIKKQDMRNIFSLCLKMAWEEAKSRKALKGTEKQIKYAEDLQKKMMDYLDERVAHLEKVNSHRSTETSKAGFEAAKKVRADYEAFFANATKASQIINACILIYDAMERIKEIKSNLLGKEWDKNWKWNPSTMQYTA